MPNCRAICDGLIPALVAARTALTCPRVNETFATSVCPLCLDDDCFATGSSVGFGWALGGNLPRRFASWTDVVMSRSNSVSVRYLTALGRSLGRTCRFEAVSVAASVAETRLVGGGKASRTISLLAQCGHAPCRNHAPTNVSKQRRAVIPLQTTDHLGSIDSGLSFLRQKRRRRTRVKTTPSTMTKLGAKVPTWVAYLPDGSGAGGGDVRRAFTAGI
jgi:hypothetical protein